MLNNINQLKRPEEVIKDVSIYCPQLSPIAAAVRIGVLGLSLAHGISQAATLEVDSNQDNQVGDGLCTLREAIAAINAGVSGADCAGSDFGVNDTINFAVGLDSNTITLGGTELMIAASKSLTIDASSIDGGITVDANQQSRVFSLADTSALTVQNTTITGGNETNGGGIYASGADLVLTDSTVSANAATAQGGGIYAYDGTLELNNSVISQNTAPEGGGVFSTYNNDLTLTDSTVSGNTATTASGGGIYCYNGCSTTLSGSTVSGNSATDAGGGIYSDSSGSTTISNSTISSNMATGQAGGIYLYDGNVEFKNTTIADNYAMGVYAGGIVNGGATITLTNTLIGNNVANDSADGDCSLQAGTITPDAATIIEDGNCNAIRSGNPGLNGLGDNGGPTQTHTLTIGSIARNTGILANCETNDQRGNLRDDGDGACDVGSVEFISSDDDTIIIVIPLGQNRAVSVPL
ncbi:MAG: right-handed parallel beta-helix repeat-containing protein [Pseudomonadota bacterium]